MKIKDCWSNKNTSEKMLKNYTGKAFPRLEHSDHWLSLENTLYECVQGGANSLIDVGCGTGDLSNLLRELKLTYTGCDLPNIIDNVAEKCNKGEKYYKFDAYKDSLEFMSDYDVLVCSGFLSMMEDSCKALGDLMKVAKKYIVVHRQPMTDKESKTIIVEDAGYATGPGYLSSLSSKDLSLLCEKNNFDLIVLRRSHNMSGPDERIWLSSLNLADDAQYYTFLLKRRGK